MGNASRVFVASPDNNLLHPRFQGFPHFAQAALEKMIPCFNANKLLRLRECADEGFELSGRGELVARSADEELWLRAGTQKFEIMVAALDRPRRKTEGDERHHTLIVIGRA